MEQCWLRFVGGEHCTVVVSLPSNKDAVETVAWLLRWCPHQARAFALAMHECAAWQYDDRRAEHWRHVLGLLPRNYVASASPRSSVAAAGPCLPASYKRLS